MQVTVSRILTVLALALSGSIPAALCQNPYYASTPEIVPIINVGANLRVAQFARLDFAQMILDQQNHNPTQTQRDHQKALIGAGTVSALDLAAPPKAVHEFNEGSALMRGQHSTDAMAHLQKAIAAYPQFVSAHNQLGLAYLDADDLARARSEFETAVNLDSRFAGSYLNLGRLALSQNDFVAAAFNLEKASTMLSTDPAILTSLAYAQNANHDYRASIETVARVHAVQHKGMAVAHYIAALAAVSLNNYPLAEAEFSVFLIEEPNHPLAAVARQNIEILQRKQKQLPPGKISVDEAQVKSAANNHSQSTSNSDRLRAELSAASEQTEPDSCDSCAYGTTASSSAARQGPSKTTSSYSARQFTVRKDVDEVDVVFTAASGRRPISDLTLNDIVIRDNNKPPIKVLRFTPQSDLPLRVGVLIDTSGSVRSHLSFEKRAAKKFLQEVLDDRSDVAFVAGFADTPAVTQDFTADRGQLASAVNGLTSDGGTALFDAVSFACWKLAAYPGDAGIAKVLVVFTDGEDNSGHTTLRQTIRDEEASGVIVYTISTREDVGDKSEADKVLLLLADRSGGEAFFPGDLMTLSRSLDRLREQIRSRYLIAYQPADFASDGRYRPITIAAEKDGKQLQVHARGGYYAIAEAGVQ